MLDNVVFQNISSLILLGGFISTAFLYIQGSTYKGTIDALKNTVDALDKRVEVQQDEINALTKRANDDRVVIERLKKDNSTLLEQRPSAEILEAIVKMIDSNHREILLLFNKENN